MGYFAYSLYGGYTEPALKLTKGDNNDFDLMLFDKVIAFDHLHQKIIVDRQLNTDNPAENYRKAAADIEEIVRLVKARRRRFAAGRGRGDSSATSQGRLLRHGGEDESVHPRRRYLPGGVYPGGLKRPSREAS